ncbi:MAG: hypothetical protein R2737_06330 [Candidatus Nanopelagicales bacterium]
MLGSFDDVRSDDLTARGRERVQQLGDVSTAPVGVTRSSAFGRLADDSRRMPRRFDALPGLG